MVVRNCFLYLKKQSPIRNLDFRNIWFLRRSWFLLSMLLLTAYWFALLHETQASIKQNRSQLLIGAPFVKF